MTSTVDDPLDLQMARYIDVLSNYVSIPSTDGRGIDEVESLLRREVDAAGLTLERHETSTNPVFFLDTGPRSGAGTILIYGHYDVFPVDGQTGWSTDPFTAVIEGDRVWGRGAGDNKGQHLAYLQALQVLARRGEPLPCRVKMIIEGDEETGSKALREFVEQHRSRLDADVCIYSDGPMFPGDQPVLLLGVRGIVCFELTATGAKRGLHSGNFGGIAPTPVMDLARLLASLVSPSGVIQLPSLRDVSLTPEQRSVLDTLPVDLDEVRASMGGEPITGADTAAYHERLTCRAFFNVSGIVAGHHGEGVKTVIPPTATAKVDIRLVGDQDPGTVVDEIRRFIADLGLTSRIDVKTLVSQPASRTPLDHPLVGRVRRAVERSFGQAVLTVPSLGATTPDYVFTKLLGLPSIVIPLAPYDENNHVQNESTKLSICRAGLSMALEIFQSIFEEA